MEKQKQKPKKNFLLAIAGAISGIWLGITLVLDAETKSHPNLSKYVGIISILFWLVVILWTAYHRFIKKE